MRGFEIVRHILLLYCTLQSWSRHSVILLLFSRILIAQRVLSLCGSFIWGISGCLAYRHTDTTPASCCVCVLSYFLGLICLHQNGMTALMFASCYGSTATLDLLLTRGANIESHNKVWYAVCLQYPFRQYKQVAEHCVVAVTSDVTDSGVR